MAKTKLEQKTIGEMLAEARRSAGLSQDELGEAVGAAGRTVSTWETGAHLPTRRVQQTLEALYGWPAGTLGYAIRNGASELPAVTASFTARPAKAGDEAARARALRGVNDALELLSDRVAELEDRVRQLESQSGVRRSRRA